MKMLSAEDKTKLLIRNAWVQVEAMRIAGGKLSNEVNELAGVFTDSEKFINAEFEEYYVHISVTIRRISEIMTFSDIGRFNDSAEHIKWITNLNKEKEEYDEIIRKHGMESQDSLVPRLKQLRIDREELSLELQSDLEHIGRLPILDKDIVERIDFLSQKSKTLKEARTTNINKLNSDTPEMVFVAYDEDNHEYHAFLDEELKSKGLTEKAATLHKILCISHYDLLRAIITNNTDFLKTLGLSDSSANIVINAIENGNITLLHKINISFSPKIGLIKNGEYFEANMLSIGERVSALFPLLTIKTGKPIILDQPEDDLDHNYIIRNIVSTIRSMKFFQQFIIVTHNPNIPVLSDSDQIIKMKRIENEKKCVPEARGAIETKSVRQHIVKLDGGLEAIEKRYKRYKS